MNRKRILVVDDEPAVSRVIAQFLERTGQYEVRESNDPVAAIDVAVEFLPDLLVLDIVMPGMDGGDFLARIRQEEQLAGVPVIFLTGIVTEAEVGSGYEITGAPVLAKPVRIDAFRKVVAEQLAGRD